MASDIPSPAGFPLHRLLDGEKEANTEVIWDTADELYNDPTSIQTAVVRHSVYSLARTRYNIDTRTAYEATSLSVRDRLLNTWNPTQQYYYEQKVKRVYYLSLEFLVGRSLQNAVSNLQLEGPYATAMSELGYELEKLYEQERDAALGNGGLGRLAACFMDSLATLDYPAWGYGIRYKYGMFAQKIIDGKQVEFPDYWLTFGSAWEIPRLDVAYYVRFYGTVTKYKDEAKDVWRAKWSGGEKVQAVAYDVPIPGYGTRNCGNIRLWSSHPAKEFDLQSFNSADYVSAIEEKRRAEDISSVLYPNDNTDNGKKLRLRQQYFFVCATLCDIMRRFKKLNLPMSSLPQQVAIQLNDTHPSLGVVELLRVLIDYEELSFDEAWDIVTRVYAYTNHTVLPEALEMWSAALIEEMLPRHMDLIYDINFRFLSKVAEMFPGDVDILARVSLIAEGPVKKVRMAHLAIVGSHTVNGVAALHTQLLKTELFKDFVAIFGESKFQNKTNGVTPRRWLHQANGELSTLITKWLEGKAWLRDLDQLANLKKHAKDPSLAKEWRAVKRTKKEQLAAYVQHELGITINPSALFDVQVKRIHEYKRQLMNVLWVIHHYLSLKAMTPTQRATVVPRVSIFGGKAAPGYYKAKDIIFLINTVSVAINNDPDIGDAFKVVFIPNYNVSVAEVIIPASDISEHISLAGMEASGTSNMKFALNGGLIIGTMDGANIEIAEQIGQDNMFICGALIHEVPALLEAQRNGTLPLDPRLEAVFAFIRSGGFGHHDEFEAIIQGITGPNDRYLVCGDFPSYAAAQSAIATNYLDQKNWTYKSILSTAGMGFFSSDRTIRQYATEIWGVEPCKLPPTFH